MRYLMFLTAVLPIAAVPINDDEQTRIAQTLDGTWACVVITHEGLTHNDANGRCVFRIGNQRVRCEAQTENSTSVSDWACKIDVARQTIDTELLKDGKPAGVVRRGIFKLEGNTLWICEGSDRPTDFTCQRGDGRFLYQLKRVNDK
ncbi:MAG: hypothetical protein K2R98_17020 [Gemmataceae bacterium]|nr:hypothetical protein [Gemmataceae bacterium]